MIKILEKNKEKTTILLKGISMGIADIIPGVSGGTMALIMGIYEQLIGSFNKLKISHLFDLFRSANFLVKSETSRKKREESIKNLKEIPWEFIIPLLFGIVVAILSMSKLISYLLDHYPFHCYAFFFGLILFSLWIPFKGVSINIKNISISLFFAVLMFFLMDESLSIEGSYNPFYIFLCGAIAISAMILPGISGSYLLVILGEYKLILEALHDFDLKIIGIFISGIAVGIYSFLRLLKFLLERYHSITMSAIAGIMLGSLRKLWPYSEPAQVASTAFQIQTAMLIIVAGLLIFLLEKAGRKVIVDKK